MKFMNRKPSTANAIKSITGALEELEAVVQIEAAQVEKIDTEIAAKVDEQNAAKERMERASKIAKRFAKLVA